MAEGLGGSAQLPSVPSLSTHHDIKKTSIPATKKAKTYNSWDSLMVTHLTTSQPVRCLNRAERTGSLVLNALWSYVQVQLVGTRYILTTYMLSHHLGANKLKKEVSVIFP
jgi:hypothetical protein